MNAGAPSAEEFVRLYLAGKIFVIERVFAQEIVWQASAALAEATPTAFVREAAWVVLSAGMSESVVRRRFSRLSGAMYGFDPAALSRNRGRARVTAITAFAHERKIDVVLDIAATVSRIGPDGLRAATWPRTWAWSRWACIASAVTRAWSGSLIRHSSGQRSRRVETSWSRPRRGPEPLYGRYFTTKNFLSLV